ncbi:MAG: crotonase [Desulfobulbaceae bacterium]|nr:MAG: crotonase [Desulfobulbaceae bacterium]
MEYSNILCEKDGPLATVTINRPKVLNALNYETLQELKHCFETIAGDRSTRVVILTGAGEKSFVAGADISFMRELNPLEARTFATLGQEVMNTIEGIDTPVIAAVNGFALGGGCELALACDIRIASENARFGQPEVNLGVVPGFGGTQRLPRLVGKGHACELLFSGDIIDAAEAARIGLVNRVVPQDQLLESCRQLAGRICLRGPVAVRLCKDAVNNGLEMDLARACRYEADLFAMCFASTQQQEGMSAFLEKRQPKFESEKD